jgi:guanylate kinase
MIDRRGIVFIISSPSGGGKTTICDSLLKSDSNIIPSVSYTTRTPRFNEIDGKDYFFVSKDDFFAMKEDGYFLEYAKVFDNYYGTPYTHINDHIKNGIDVLLNIDWQGLNVVENFFKDDVVSVFILPPSIDVLRNRLINRNTDSIDVIDERMNCAKNEINHCTYYQYLVINDILDSTILNVKSILNSERMRYKRLLNFTNILRSLYKF